MPVIHVFARMLMPLLLLAGMSACATTPHAAATGEGYARDPRTTAKRAGFWSS